MFNKEFNLYCDLIQDVLDMTSEIIKNATSQKELDIAKKLNDLIAKYLREK
jgi:hypothetical protein